MIVGGPAILGNCRSDRGRLAWDVVEVLGRVARAGEKKFERSLKDVHRQTEGHLKLVAGGTGTTVNRKLAFQLVC